MCLLFLAYLILHYFFASGAFSSIIIVPELPFTIHVNQYATIQTWLHVVLSCVYTMNICVWVWKLALLVPNEPMATVLYVIMYDGEEPGN